VTARRVLLAGAVRTPIGNFGGARGSPTSCPRTPSTRRAAQSERRAIPLGHPTGCSGTRIVVTLPNEQERPKGRYGLATPCVRCGQGMALLVERL
jgi:acetyl-CoA acetyltransferase